MKLTDLIASATEDEMSFLANFGMEPRPRKLLSRGEIRTCGALVKRGLMERGTSDDRPRSVIYYVDSAIYSRLDRN
jgi:hypothetical protein